MLLPELHSVVNEGIVHIIADGSNGIQIESSVAEYAAYIVVTAHFSQNFPSCRSDAEDLITGAGNEKMHWNPGEIFLQAEISLP
jgi:hypothetical protein